MNEENRIPVDEIPWRENEEDNGPLVRCELCGRQCFDHDAYHETDEANNRRRLCPECYNRRWHTAIHDYSYKPAPAFYGDGPRYYGIELELDNGGDSRENAQTLLNLVNGWSNRNERIYIKHDGSLDDGFEIVTHPMSLDYHMAEMPWDALTEGAARAGYRSHSADTCGLHVHVSRAALGATEKEQDATIARILYFVEHHWGELLKFSRRTQRQLDRWARRYGLKEFPEDILYHAKARGDRYTAVNLTNRATVEFRMFRGTLKASTIRATLLLLEHIIDLALMLDDKEMASMCWTDFVARNCTEPELVDYLRARRLYVNEPVTEEGGDL